MAGLEAYVDGVPGGLGAFAGDPMGDATAALEARRRQQVMDAGYDPDKGLYDRYSEMLGTVLGPTINERAAAAREAMRRGDMATANALNQSLALDFGQFLGSIKPIRAYHGSPHDFNKFSMDKIGTGEGGQAYGHGLYFAENEGVARSYRDALAPPRRIVSPDGMEIASKDDGGNFWSRFGYFSSGDAEKSRQGAALRRLLDASGDYESAVASAPAEIKDALRSMQNAGLRYDAPSPGRMYEVNIHADPERFLDWDKPLSGQPKEVRAALGGIYDDAITGADIARLSAADARDVAIMRGDNAGTTLPESQRRASDGLRQLGIPGIKYLDQGSRAAGDGSRNYVVFDDKLIEILRKYGIVAPAAGLGALATYGSDDPNL